MNISFSIYSEKYLLNDPIEGRIDWNFPFLPRIGEEIGTHLLLKSLNPQDVYFLLDDDSQKKWDRKREDYDIYVQTHKELEEQEFSYLDPLYDIETYCLIQWMYNVSFRIENICWDDLPWKDNCIFMDIRIKDI